MLICINLVGNVFCNQSALPYSTNCDCALHELSKTQLTFRQDLLGSIYSLNTRDGVDVVILFARITLCIVRLIMNNSKKN